MKWAGFFLYIAALVIFGCAGSLNALNSRQIASSGRHDLFSLFITFV